MTEGEGRGRGRRGRDRKGADRENRRGGEKQKLVGVEFEREFPIAKYVFGNSFDVFRP